MILRSRIVVSLLATILLCQLTDVYASKSSQDNSNDSQENQSLFEYDPEPVQLRDYEFSVGIGHKLDTTMTLIERAFEKINERIDRLDNNIANVDSKLQAELLVVSRFASKTYNVVAETYSLSKELLTVHTASPRFTRTSNSGKKVGRWSRKNTDEVPSTIEIESGTDENVDRQEDDMHFVLTAVANQTADRVVDKLDKRLTEESKTTEWFIKSEIKNVQRAVNSTNSIVVDEIKHQIRTELNQFQTFIEDNRLSMEELEERIKKLQNRIPKTEQFFVKELNKHEESFQKILDENLKSLVHRNSSVSIVDTSKTNDKQAHFDSQVTPNTDRVQDPAKNVVQTTDSQSSSRSRNYEPLFTTVHAEAKEVATPSPTTTTTTTTPKPEVTAKLLPYKPKFASQSLKKGNCQPQMKAGGFPRTCADVQAIGATCDRVYVVVSTSYKLSHVYCSEMMPQPNITGGWTVVLRRGRSSAKKCSGRSNSCDLSFVRRSHEYISGFGDMHSGEFFIGLERIHQYTHEPQLLQIDLEDSNGSWISLRYLNFRLENHNQGYRFHYDNIVILSETESNLPYDEYLNIAETLKSINGSRFVFGVQERTLDARHKRVSNCLKQFKSDWWVASDRYDWGCSSMFNLNLFAPLNGPAKLFWNGWPKNADIHNVIMKIRPLKDAVHQQLLQAESVLSKMTSFVRQMFVRRSRL